MRAQTISAGSGVCAVVREGLAIAQRKPGRGGSRTLCADDDA